MRRAALRWSARARLAAVAAPSPFGLPSGDLDATCDAARQDLEALRGARILVTGGTGFLGSWITGTLLHACDRFGLACEVAVLSRDPARVDLAERAGLRLVAGDVGGLAGRSDLGRFDVVIHAAASSSARVGEGDGEPRAMAATVFDGTRAALEVAGRSRARLLFLSSGAVYGPQVEPVGEDARGAPDQLQPGSAYGEAKRLAENLCAAASASGDAECVIGRLFAFVGPRIPVEAHYAAGNFLGAALERRAIVVEGDGRPLRSYLYTADLAEWCLALLARGEPGTAYNVGSPSAVSILELAERCRDASGADLPVEVRSPAGTGPVPCYVPVTRRAERDLGLSVRTPLVDALRRTLAWLRAGR